MTLPPLARTHAPALALAGLLLGGCSSQVAPAHAPVAASSGLPRPERLAGLDPYDTGCAADAVLTSRVPALDPHGDVVAFVELRRSGRCETAWGRAVRVASAKGALVASVEARGFSSAFEHATDGEVWTDMVPASGACATVSGGLRVGGGVEQSAHASWCDERSPLRVTSR